MVRSPSSERRGVLDCSIHQVLELVVEGTCWGRRCRGRMPDVVSCRVEVRARRHQAGGTASARPGPCPSRGLRQEVHEEAGSRMADHRIADEERRDHDRDRDRGHVHAPLCCRCARSVRQCCRRQEGVQAGCCWRRTRLRPQWMTTIGIPRIPRR